MFILNSILTVLIKGLIQLFTVFCRMFPQTRQCFQCLCQTTEDRRPSSRCGVQKWTQHSTLNKHIFIYVAPVNRVHLWSWTFNLSPKVWHFTDRHCNPCEMDSARYKACSNTCSCANFQRYSTRSPMFGCVDQRWTKTSGELTKTITAVSSAVCWAVLVVLQESQVQLRFLWCGRNWFESMPRAVQMLR